MLNGKLDKTKYYALQTQSQERHSRHVHSLIWIFSAPNNQHEEAYTEFAENKRFPVTRS